MAEAAPPRQAVDQPTRTRDAASAPVQHRSAAALTAGLDHVRRAPRDGGRIEMLVVRPGPGRRRTLRTGELSVAHGLEGDDWATRGSPRTPDGGAHPDMQLTLINVRLLQLLAGSRTRWPLAGDQLVVDLDLGTANLPPGRRLRVGAATVEVTAEPHTGCVKFAERFGRDALRLVSTAEGRALRLRGIYVRVVAPGTVDVGDTVSKLPPG